MTDSLRIDVRVVPRASRTAVIGMRSGWLLVRVTAMPMAGAANEALVRVVAKRLYLATGAVRVVTGRTAKLKVIEVQGLAHSEALRRLGVAPMGERTEELAD